MQSRQVQNREVLLYNTKLYSTVWIIERRIQTVKLLIKFDQICMALLPRLFSAGKIVRNWPGSDCFRRLKECMNEHP